MTFAMGGVPHAGPQQVAGEDITRKVISEEEGSG